MRTASRTLSHSWCGALPAKKWAGAANPLPLGMGLPGELTITGLPVGVEVRCYVGKKDGTAIEVGGIETTVSDTLVISHAVGGQAGFFRMIDEDYKIVAFDYTYQSGAAEILIQPDQDPWFKNP